jgi:hypothetical protein
LRALVGATARHWLAQDWLFAPQPSKQLTSATHALSFSQAAVSVLHELPCALCSHATHRSPPPVVPPVKPPLVPLVVPPVVSPLVPPVVPLEVLPLVPPVEPLLVPPTPPLVAPVVAPLVPPGRPHHCITAACAAAQSWQLAQEKLTPPEAR